MPEKTVLPSNLGGGSKGVGDPDDMTLRKVEKEIKIPQIMRDRAKAEKCIPEVEKFSECCKRTGLLMTFKCKEETKELKSCLEKWYQDEGFKRECTEIYLEKRRQFRLSGKKETIPFVGKKGVHETQGSRHDVKNGRFSRPTF